jgi:hypothetical protein
MSRGDFGVCRLLVALGAGCAQYFQQVDELQHPHVLVVVPVRHVQLHMLQQRQSLALAGRRASLQLLTASQLEKNAT